MKAKFKDRLKILTTGSVRMENLSQSIEQYLSLVFSKTRYLYSRKNVFGQILNVVKDISQLLFHYHEVSIQESNVITAQDDISLRHFAELSGYNVTYVKSSQGLVRMDLLPTFFSTFGNILYLRRYAVFKNTLNSLLYLVDIDTDQKVIMQGSSRIYIPLIEGEVKNANFIADGSKQYKILLSDTGKKIDDSRLRVWVNNKLYKRYDSILDMNINSDGYFVKTGYTSQYEIIFGNGINGTCPNVGDSIDIEYIISQGEDGNIPENQYPFFELVSGLFNINGEDITPSEHAKIIKESGFILGSNGDSIETLRSVVGYNSRSLILVDDRSFKAFLSKYSFISKIFLYDSPDNPRIKNILLLPDLSTRFESVDDYFECDEDMFRLSQTTKDNLKDVIQNSESSYIANELIWMDAEYVKYVLFIYLEPKTSTLNKNEIYNSIKQLAAEVFLEYSFSRLRDNSNIPKSYIISKIQELIGDDVRISINIFSHRNEEAKINGYYNKLVYNIDGIKKYQRIELAHGDDPFLGLSNRNDINLEQTWDIPLLRAGFPILSKNGEAIKIENPVNLYIKTDDDWEILTK